MDGPSLNSCGPRITPFMSSRLLETSYLDAIEKSSPGNGYLCGHSMVSDFL